MPFSKVPYEFQGLSIYVDAPKQYLAQCYLLYHAHAQYINHKIEQLTQYEGPRKAIMEALRRAYIHNLEPVNELLSALNEQLSAAEVLNAKLHRTSAPAKYLTDYLYLQRDWEGEAGEAQIMAVKNALIQGLEKAGHSPGGNALILGAGLNRYALELHQQFDQLYITDKSLSMAWNFNRLRQNPFHFYEINLQNAKAPHNIVERISVSIPEHLRKVIEEKSTFFIADAMNIPLMDNSFNAVFSIYFSDVMALKLLFREVNRVLQPGGYFIHFGPLQYFFENEGEMLSAEEFKAHFLASGYELVFEDYIEAPHLPSRFNLRQTLYNNWLMVVRQKPQARQSTSSHVQALVMDSVPNFVNPLKYEVAGSFEPNATTEEQVTLIIDQERFSIDPFLLHILNAIDGNRSISEIIQFFQEDYFLEAAEKTAILEFLQQLCDKGLLLPMEIH